MRSQRLKAAVLHVNPCSVESNAPTARIALFVAAELGIPLIHNKETMSLFGNEEYDVLFVKFGILKFCEYRDKVMELYGRARRIINLENDFAFVPDKRLTNCNPSYEVWSTVPSNVEVYGGAYINWNKLTWWETEPYERERIPGLFYYGAYRAGREKYFKQYFGKEAASYAVHISTHNANVSRFKQLNPEIMVYGPFRHHLQMRPFSATIYLEDVGSHVIYCSPANRFYECLSMGLPMYFDVNCRLTMETAGYNIDEYVVEDPSEINLSSRRLIQMEERQRRLWTRNYLSELKKELRTISKRELR